MSDFNRYSAWYKTLGKFDLYLDEYDAEDGITDPTDYVDVAIKLTVKGGDDPAVRRQVYSTLGSLARAISKKEDEIDEDENHSFDIIIGEKLHEKHKILNEKITEFMIDSGNLPYEELEKLVLAEDQAFQMETITGELMPDISNVKISLSCAFKENNSSKYVKVRFAGFSVQFYFNNQKWLKSKTEEELDLVPTKKKLVMRVLEANADMILERARGKAVNSSGIGISTPIELHVLLPDNKGWKLALDNKAVNNPDVTPVLLLREDSYETKNNYLIDENNVYTVTAWSRKKADYEWGAQNQGPMVEDLRFVEKDKSLRILPKHLAPAQLDDFTKKRIERAIKRRL